jgi:hypothetical protein
MCTTLQYFNTKFRIVRNDVKRDFKAVVSTWGTHSPGALENIFEAARKYLMSI